MRRLRRPGVPENEEARLEALATYRVMDTPTDAAFDDIAKLAAHILNVPIALVSLVDADRQWFKARYGLEATQTPRDISFCGHVVEFEEALVVADTHEDDRFVDNPLVLGEPHVRFYAGMPLRTGDGFVLGTLCAIDHQVRTPSAEQLEMLRILAAQVVDQLEARRVRLALAKETETLKHVAERQTLVFNTMAEGVVVQTAEGAISECNAAAEEILGLTNDELCGRSSLDPKWRAIRQDGTPFPGDQHPAMVSLRTGQPLRNVVMGVHKPNDVLTWISINSMPHVVDERVVEVVTTFHDITALKRATVHAAQTERLVTVGTLAAGVGHEINNPLAYILGNLDLCLEEVQAIAGPSPSARLDELAVMLREAREGADRIRRIVRGLRALAREDVALQGVDLRHTVEISLSMASHELRHKTIVVQNLAELPPVLADESRLIQVIVNLLMNAAQAFESFEPTNTITLSSLWTDDQRVAIVVKDNGPGIPESIRSRVFDPFFTTKPVGQGTGLGLAMSRNIVDSLHGELHLETVVGAGTTFTVILPVAPAIVPTTHATQIVKGRRGRILVVDDEPAVVNTVRRILERDHEVLAMTDARDALAAFERNEVLDLVLCDLSMPYLTGEQLYERALALDPSLARKFVFVTGGATTPELRYFLEHVPSERLSKPFSLIALQHLAHRFVEASQESGERELGARAQQGTAFNRPIS